MADRGFVSSTQTVPAIGLVPRHIAIIMDGNGRWARKRFLPRVSGHTRGVEALRGATRAAIERGVEYLTVFAFSSENWRRPVDEVSFLMQLFIKSLQKEAKRLHQNGIRFRVIGDRSRFDPGLVKAIVAAEELTADNTRLHLTVAANYGGRWDVLSAVNRLLARQPGLIEISEEALAAELSMSFAPEPDLFIRTGGEQRISNFLLWQLAYSEFYFTDALWPDFDAHLLDEAIASYRERERRFGRTSEQLSAVGDAERHV
ncbi:MAG: di-trans,poly-cis-decaprenylcistransferase [Azoarcus sp.]|jgi:undecaprenyl diphosphate synthase|nr:di-trans,poly-cis-decaprenylcistransferase [Azoarcus sp.]